jgi:hypothetical protein
MPCHPLLLLLATTVALSLAAASDSIHYKDIKALTLRRGYMTTGRRSDPVPQLVCVGGSAQHAEQPAVVQCQNAGFDGQSYQWKCEADVDESLRIGEVTVTCEGYHHRDDQMVLVGSCGLEYTLEYAKPKQQQQRKQEEVVTKKHTTTTTKTETQPKHVEYHDRTRIGDTTGGHIFILGMIIILGVILILSFCYGTPAPQQSRVSSTHRSMPSVSSNSNSSSGPSYPMRPAPVPTTTVIHDESVTHIHHSPQVMSPPPPPVQVTHIHTTTPVVMTRPVYNSDYAVDGYVRDRHVTGAEPPKTTTTTTTVSEETTSTKPAVYSPPSLVGKTHKTVAYGGTRGR